MIIRKICKKITDIKEQQFLVKAAQDWDEGRAHLVAANNPIYQNLIARFPYLDNKQLFEHRALTLQEQVEEAVTQLQDTHAQSADIVELRNRTLHAYDLFHELRRSEETDTNDDKIFDQFIEHFAARSPVWRILLDSRKELTKEYAAGRTARREAQITQGEPLSSQASSSSSSSSSSR